MTDNERIDNLDKPTLCDNCIHDDVCGLEGHLEPAMTYCGWKEERRPQGKWIPTVIDTRLYERSVCREWQCSNCGEVVKMKYPFCHCGADMRGGDNG